MYRAAQFLKFGEYKLLFGWLKVWTRLPGFLAHANFHKNVPKTRFLGEHKLLFGLFEIEHLPQSRLGLLE